MNTANEWALPPDPTAAYQARRCVEHVCGGVSPEKVEVALLLVTELVTNALQHGSGTVVLLVDRDDGGVRVQVEDDGLGVPVLVEPEDPWPEHGAGMRLVAALSDSWGVAPRSHGDAGKGVWFALA